MKDKRVMRPWLKALVEGQILRLTQIFLIRSSVAMKYRGQRVSTRKSGQDRRRNSGISNESGSWEEKFNMRSSKERVVAAFEGAFL